MFLDLKGVVLDKVALDCCGYKTWKEFIEASPTSWVVERAVQLALLSAQAEVLKVVDGLEEGFEGTAVEFCEKHGDASYTGFKKCLWYLRKRLLVKPKEVRE